MNARSFRVVRSARPPRGLATPARVDAGEQLRCIVLHDTPAGVPLAAVLVPVICVQGQWRLLAHGRAIAAPATADVERCAASLGSIEAVGEDRALVRAPWPRGAHEALLLLLHPQVERIDAAAWELPAEQELAPAAPAEPAAPGAAASAAEYAAVCRCLRESPAGELERGVIFRTARVLPLEATRRDNEAPRLRLAACSGQFPAALLDGGVTSQSQALRAAQCGPAERSLWRLGERMLHEPDLRQVLLCGGQAWIDALPGAVDPDTLWDRYAFAYERMFANKGLQRVLRIAGAQLRPLADRADLDPGPPAHSQAWRGRRDYAVRIEWFRDRQGRMADSGAGAGGELWGEATWGPHAAFLLDTRSEREARDLANATRARILGERQERAFEAWLGARAGEDAPAFIVSASMVLPRRRCVVGHPAQSLHCEAWCGYPHSLHALLARLCDARTRHLILVSGNEGRANVCEVLLENLEQGTQARVHAVQVPAAYAPYPFANAQPEDYAQAEEFEFRWPAAGARYRCQLRTQFAPGADGFAVLATHRRQGGWEVDVEFDLGGMAPLVTTLRP